MREVTARAALTAPLLLALGLPAFAQQTPQAPARRGTVRKSAAADVDPLEEVRRATAVQLVSSLADEARNFSDAGLRARAQARAADVLWATDQERARTLFRRAWEAAEAADLDTERREEEERRRQMAERGYFSMRRGPSLRTEVLRLAARRDRALGEEFLTEMEEARKKEAGTDAPPADAANEAARRRDTQYTPPAAEKRLRLAGQLLQDGDTERAVQFADPALQSPTVLAVDFLSRLRTRNAQAADQRFAQLLARAQGDPASDANTVSILSSYLFTPGLFITFDREAGSNGSRYGETLPAPSDLSPQLQAAFFNAAAAVLMRPTPPAEQDQTTSGRAGAYMVITRLLPLFERHAPDRAAALRTRLASLTPDTPERAREPGNNAITRGLVPEDPNRNHLPRILERLERAKSDDERDAIYADAAVEALRLKDSRLDEFVGKISDVDTRRQVRAYVDFEALREAVREKDTAAALRLAREGELPSVKRVWGLTEVARLVAKDEPGRAVELLEEAGAEARKIDQGTPDRVRALVAITTRLADLDRARAWDSLAEVVKASNAAEGFTGEDARLDVEMRTKMGVMRTSNNAETFDLDGLFAALARENLDRAAEIARAFKAEHPRTAATLAVARAVLDTKEKRAAR